MADEGVDSTAALPPRHATKKPSLATGIPENQMLNFPVTKEL
jgi:hypothetical protein